MTDYSAHDIHLLDQAYPDALASIEHLTGDPARKRRLADAGPEVFAAELTRELAATFTNPTSLAGWAAVATARLMEAGQTWEEDTEMAYEQRDAARAKVDELTAELAKARKDRDEYAEDNTRVAVALIDVQRKLAGLEADHASAVQANTAYANENARLRSQLAEQQPVVEAAKAWRAQFAKPAATKAPRMAALIAAVDALPTEPKAEADGDDKPCCGYGCNDNLTGMPS